MYPAIIVTFRRSFRLIPDHTTRMNVFISSFLFLSLFLWPSHLLPQKKMTFSGTVTEKGSGETLPGVIIISPEFQAGTTTNNYGFYSITLDGPGTLVFRFTGYDSYTVKVDENSPSRLNVELGTAETTLKEIVISAEETRKISEETQMSTIDVPIDQIRKIPALLGEKDVLKVIQLLPGVQKGSEGNSGFYVRGGGPDQNLIILDDATVYNASHLFGFFSIFNGDALKSVELVKGGFPARYGGRLSSVLEMQMKDGNKEKISGEAGIGLISSRLTLEGPIKKGKSSFLVSGRRTYIDALIYPFLPPDQKAGYYFYDLNAKANWILDDRNRLYVSGYFGKDKFYFRPSNGDGTKDDGSFLWGNATATARWNRILSDKAFSNTSLIFSRYNLGIRYETVSNANSFELRYDSGIRDWGIKHDIDWRPNANHAVRTGVAVTYHRFTPSATVVRSSDNFENRNEVEAYDCFENGIYVEDDWTITPKLKANVGMRFSHFATGTKNYFGVEPRVSGRYMLKDDLSIKWSYALMNQYLHLLSTTGVGLPTDLWVPATDRIAPQRAHQVAAGFAKDIDEPRLTVTLEGYYKRMDKVIGYKEGASFLSIGVFGEDTKLTWEDNVTSGMGESYGAEIMIQRKTGKLTGWIGYTLSWTTLQFDELNNGKKFFARYDRRHDVSVVGIYEIKENVTLSATWVYGTGQAITLPLADYASISHDPSGITPSLYQGFPGVSYSTDYGEKNSFRMAPYHRLDIACQWRKKLKRTERTFELGVYNAYNRANPFFYTIQTRADGSSYLSQISLFPILPSVSWTYKF